ncbi:ATP-dependent zinc metalloprotease FtsH [Candidatus Ruminimicrobiellum ovillum]|uniref:ATP-dependent zinc metalloprotease FtsH n=1 Tax=Candidatus Ruminimicrobiellum ovillum TaxID=1947927 RepID=UPI003559A0C4
MKKKDSWGFAFWIVLAAILLIFMQNSTKKSNIEEMPYSQFKQSVKEGKIINAVVTPELIEGEFTDKEGNQKKFKTIPLEDPKLVEDMENNNVQKFSGKAQNGWLGPLIFSWGPIILLILFWLWIMRGMSAGGKQAMTFAKSKARLADNGKKITFKEVAGCEEAKEELQEIVEFLKNPSKFQKLGGKIPKGVLLAGAPGTGKTLLAKAVAGEAGVPFFSSSGSEFVEMFVGVGASRVRDLFEQGRKNAPCLLFIDEIDAVGRHRGAGLGGGNDEREQTLNQILVEMDGFDTKEGVIIIAATNRPDVLDPALLRAGRFDRQVVVNTPDLKDREEILKVHVKNIKVDKEVDLKVLARRTPGFVGADLANLTNEAALLAARKNLETVTMKCFEEAIDKIMAGPQKKSRVISDKEKSIIAYHEAGHTIVAKMIPNTDPVHKVTIMASGRALGYTLQVPLEDKFLSSKSEIEARLAILMGGRVAEEIVFGDITTGASNDISRATQIATKMVTAFGMSDKIGTLALEKDSEEVFLGRDISRTQKHSNKTAELIDEEVKNIVTTAKNRAKKILEGNRDKLDNLVKALIERETLNGEQVNKIMEGQELEPIHVEPKKEETPAPVEQEKKEPEIKAEPEPVKQEEPKTEEPKQEEKVEDKKEEQLKVKKVRKTKTENFQNDLFAKIDNKEENNNEEK